MKRVLIDGVSLYYTVEGTSTSHTIRQGDSRNMEVIGNGSVNLVVTSPPYPMIEMWDHIFSEMDPEVAKALAELDGESAYRLMNDQLNLVWKEVTRVTRDGGMVCINIGDATRTLGRNYKLYPSHTAISHYFRKNGFDELPSIIWKKPSNSPNKFLGSGTLPVNAYVTLEHEYILIFRKRPRRDFSNVSDGKRRQESAFFWEERNTWFSDVWENLRGTRQRIQAGGARDRSGAFPVELPFRLINMYSIKGDTVLDPFAGTGSTAIAAAASERNSIGYELDVEMSESARATLLESRDLMNSLVEKRIADHRAFVEYEASGGREFKHYNRQHGFPVVTKSEGGIIFRNIYGISEGENREIKISYV